MLTATNIPVATWKRQGTTTTPLQPIPNGPLDQKGWTGRNPLESKATATHHETTSEMAEVKKGSTQ
eukprot:2640382-Lingulodinium_polyedra.AAC.1